MTLGSLFDGIGGFPLAAVRAGIKPVWASEIEKAPISITKRHFPEMAHLGDITKINGGDIEPVDVITFGSPCQDLSIAGLRAGLEGKRSGLFTEALRVIKEMKDATNGKYPARIVWENVPGAFSANKGKDFQKVIGEIAKTAGQGISIPRPPKKSGWLAAGGVVGDCWSVAWRVLDARYWGVPQRRRRIFLVADFGSQRAGEILFKPENRAGNFETGGEKGDRASRSSKDGFKPAGANRRFDNGWRGVTGSLEYQEECSPCINTNMPPNVVERYYIDFGHRSSRIQMSPETAVTLMGEGGGVGAKTGLYCLPAAYCLVGNTIDRAEKSDGNVPGFSEETGYTLNTTDRQAVAVPFIFNGFGKYVQGDVGKTLLTRDDITTADLIVSKYAVRRLTPLECERLQGYPDGWTEFGHNGVRISDNQRYKALGNSVAIPCVEFVMRGINNEQRQESEGHGTRQKGKEK